MKASGVIIIKARVFHKGNKIILSHLKESNLFRRSDKNTKQRKKLVHHTYTGRDKKK